MSTSWLPALLIFATATTILAATTKTLPAGGTTPKPLKHKKIYPYVIPGCSDKQLCPWLPLGPPLKMINGVKPCFREKKCVDTRDCNYENDEVCRDNSCMQLFCKKLICHKPKDCPKGKCEAGMCGNVV